MILNLLQKLILHSSGLIIYFNLIMMKFLLIVCFCTEFLVATAQKKNYATLRLTYPAQLTYDTLLVKDADGSVLSPQSKLIKGKSITNVYLLSTNQSFESSFSIYFGGSVKAVNDTLYFLNLGSNSQVEIKDSFALRDRINIVLKNVYNFEELYKRYEQYFNSRMQEYYSSVKGSTDPSLSKKEYLLKAKFDFVKKNLKNPYSIDLFSFFVIDFKAYDEYNAIHEFYENFLKSYIKDPKVKGLVEAKIEKLKQSLNEGNRTPSFSVHTIQNQLINNDILSGKNVLFTFWATWCEPCIKEIPYLKQIQEEYKSDNLVIIAVSLDKDSLKMANMVNAKKLNWLHIFNDRSILESFHINPIPALFLIDEKGIILYNSVNKENETPDLKILRSVLKQKFKH